MQHKIPKYKICPSCDYFCTETDDQDYCLRCGKQLMAKCPACDQQIINPYSKYCSKCGSALRCQTDPSKIKLS